MHDQATWKSAISAAVAAALAGALCLAAAGPVAAATLEGTFKAFSAKPEKKRLPFEHFVQHSCSSSTCTFDVLKVPKNKRLEIRNISCYSYVDSGGEIFWIKILRNRTEPDTMSEFLTPVREYDDTAVYFASSNEVRLIADAGDTLTYQGSASNNIGHLWCHMAGDQITFKK